MNFGLHPALAGRTRTPCVPKLSQPLSQPKFYHHMSHVVAQAWTNRPPVPSTTSPAKNTSPLPTSASSVSDMSNDQAYDRAKIKVHFDDDITL